MTRQEFLVKIIEREKRRHGNVLHTNRLLDDKTMFFKGMCVRLSYNDSGLLFFRVYLGNKLFFTSPVNTLQLAFNNGFSIKG